MALLVVRWEAGPVARWTKCSNKSWKTTLSSQGTCLKASRVTAKKKNSTYYFLRDVEEGEMLMMMIMSANHTMPVTGPCDIDSGEALLRTQYLWAKCGSHHTPVR
jgi:hypothetical protein